MPGPFIASRMATQRRSGTAEAAAPTFTEGVAASFRTARDDQGGHMNEEVMDAYAPVIEQLVEAGYSPNRYIGTSRLASPINTGAVWADIAARRRTDAKAFAGIPADKDAFETQAIARAGARMRRDQTTAGRAGLSAQLVGGMAGGLTDPINLGAMVLTGGAGSSRSALSVIGREALINGATELAQQPIVATERAKSGRELTGEEAAINVVAGTLLGGAVGGAAHVVPPIANRTLRSIKDRLPDPNAIDLSRVWQLMPEKVRAKYANAGAVRDIDLPEIADDMGISDRLSEEQQAAMAALRRDGEVAAASPFEPGAGTAAHLRRVDAEVAALNRPVSPTGAAQPATPAVPAYRRDTLSDKIAQVESRGSYRAQSATSSAYGRYQFTKGTWNRLLMPSHKGYSEEALWNLRTNPALQERAFTLLTEQNEAALARIGARQSYGNMYLMHFAGSGGASKILRAAPDTPIEEVLSKAAIDANSFLKGKTAGDVVEWAHRKMGEDAPSGPRVRRDAFDAGDAGDVEWRAAQREVDDAEDALAQAERDAARSIDEDDADAIDPFDPRGWDDDGDVPSGADWEPMPRSRWSSEVERLRTAQAGEITGAMTHPDIAGPIDVKWGKAGDPANGFKGGHGLSHILAKHPEMEALIDDLPDMIADMTVKQRRAERMVLESADHEASIALTWHGEDQRWLVTAYEKGKTPADPTSARGSIGGGSGSPRPGAARTILDDADQGNAAASLRMDWARQQADGKTPPPTWAIRPEGGGEIAYWVGGDRRFIDRALASWDQPGAWEAVRLHPPEDLGPPAVVTGFDTPDDVAAERQIGSMEHDLRQFLDEDEAQGLTVRLNDEGDVISAADALADLDDDDAAIEIARGCM